MEAALDRGRIIPLSRVTSRLLRIDLPAENILGVRGPQTGLSVADGFVALLHPPTPGTHKVAIRTVFPKGNVLHPEGTMIANTTTIIVEPGR